MSINLDELESVRTHIVDKVGANMTNPISGWSLLIDASMFGRIEIVKHLLDKGANVNYSCPLGWTALMVACVNRHFEIMKLLIENGADVNAKHKDGFSPIMFVMLNKGTGEMINFLMEKGANMIHAFNWLKVRGFV